MSRTIRQEHLTLLRRTIQERYHFTIRKSTTPYIGGHWAEDSPLGELYLPFRTRPELGVHRQGTTGPSNTSKPTTVRTAIPKKEWPDYEYAIMHEMTHLALWHSRWGVMASNEADCIVLEAAWADDIIGRGWGHVMTLALGHDTGIPYEWGKPANPSLYRGDMVSQWHRPRRAAWWGIEQAKLTRLGVLDAEGKPTYRRADWRGVPS